MDVERRKMFDMQLDEIRRAQADMQESPETPEILDDLVAKLNRMAIYSASVGA